MKQEKIERLESKGWKVGSADEFLNLTPAESVYLNLKLALSQSLRDRRQKREMTQTELAELVNSSQSRIAKMESGDSSVSLDLLIRSLLALDVSTQELAEIIMTPDNAFAT